MTCTKTWSKHAVANYPTETNCGIVRKFHFILVENVDFILVEISGTVEYRKFDDLGTRFFMSNFLIRIQKQMLL